MTEDLTGQNAIRGDQAPEVTGFAEPQDGSQSEGTEILVGQAGETVVVTRPAPGQTVEIQAAAGQTYVLDFPPADARVQAQGGNLILGFDDNGDGTIDSRIVFLELAQVADSGDAPILRIAGNDVDAGALYRQALALGGEEAPPLDDVAGGPDALGGGGTYEDDLGSTIDLLAGQGIIPPTELQFGLIDLEDEITVLEDEDLPPPAENTPPEADPVLTPASLADGGEGGLPPELADALAAVGLGGGGAIPAGWTVLGDVTATDASFGIAPQQGSGHLALSASGADQTAIEAFFGLDDGTLDDLPGIDDAEDGSAIKTTLTVQAGDTVTFHFNFLDLEQYDGEPGFNDFAFVVFGSEVVKLADVISTDSGAIETAIGTVAQTGYNEFTVTFTTAGDFVFGFGVMNEDDTSVDSGLLIDNIVHESGESASFLTGFDDAEGATADIVFFKQLVVDGDIDDDDSGEVADFGGADGETALGDLTFTLQSNPTYGQLILVTSGGVTSFLTPGDTFSSADTVWWIATQDQIDDFLSSEGAPEFLPNVTFDYSVTDADGAVATAPVVITLPRDVTPPEVALDLYGGADCIEEDSSLGDFNNEVTVSVTPDGDDLLTEIVLSGFQADWTYDLTGLDSDGAGSGVVVTDNIAGDGTVTITFSPGINASYNGSFAVQPPADSDVDHPTIVATATVVDPADSGLTASNDGSLDIHVDANADGGEGSAGDDGDGVHLSVALSVADGADGNATFQSGETGTLTVSATFDDFQDGSETHTVTVAAPEGFSIGAVIGSLPAGVSVVSNDGTTLVLSVDSLDGDGLDGVGDFSVTFAVTNVDALGGTAEFTAEARAVETSTDDIECDPSDADNVATVTTEATATVANITPPEVALDLYGGECIEEDSTLASINNQVSVSVTPDGDDLLTEIVLSGLQADWTYDLTGLDTDGAGSGVVVTDNIAGDGTVTITFSPGINASYNGSFAVQPPADSDVDHPTITATATAIDPVDNTLSASNNADIDIHVDAVVDGSEVEQTTPAEGDENTEIPLNLQIDLGGDSTTGPGESQGGTDKDGSESVTRLVVMLSVGALMWDLPASIAAPIEGPDGTWTFDTSGADLADVQALVSSLSVTPPVDFEGDITATVTTTTAEAATEVGPNGASGEECDDINNVDVDTYEFTVTVNPTLPPTPVLVVGQNVDDIEGQEEDHVFQNPEGQPDGEIVGNDGDDVLIGDVGGGALDGKTMNLVLVLDTSNSMEEQIEFNGVSMTRIEALDKAVESLLDKLADTAGLTVRLHMVSFNTDVTGEATFNIITNGVVDEAALQAAKDFILADTDSPTAVAQGNTNYEAGFQAAVDWFSDDANTLDDPDFNKTIFVSDGLPNRSYRGDGTTQVTAQGGAQTSLNHVLGQQPAEGSFPADTVSEYQALLGEFKGVNGTVDAIGINVDGQGVAVLSQVDQDDADSIDEGQELADALDGLSQVTELAAVGDDVIVGNGGADLIFGDAIYTDILADENAIDLSPGSGWAVIEALRGSGFFDADPSMTEVEEIMALLRARAEEFGRESVNSEGVGREGGDDTIDGGGGHDLIFGQEGDDLIDGGAGEDVIIGGTGDDTMTGGADEDTFLWTDQFIAGETDTVTDFDGPAGDRLDLSALLEGSPTESGVGLQGYLNITFDGTNTTIGVDVNGDASGFTDVTIVCEGVDLTGGSVDQAGIIQSLIDSGQLETNGIV